MPDEPYWLDRVLANNAEAVTRLPVALRDTPFSHQKDTPMPTDNASAVVTVTQADRVLADAIAGALVKYAVAYTHNTLNDMSTANRSWKVHEAGHGNPFEHGVWLGEFDNKADANALCSKLRREAAYEAAARHRLAAQAESAARVEALREALIWADLKIRSYPGADQSDVEFIRAALSVEGAGS